MHAGRKKGQKMSLVILTFDLDRETRLTKLVFCVNLAQIHSAVHRDISYTKKKPQTDGTKTEPYTVHCVW